MFICHLEFTRYLTCMLMYHILLRHIWSLRSAFEQQGEGQPLRSLRPQSPSAIGQRTGFIIPVSRMRETLTQRADERDSLWVYRYGRDLLLKPLERSAHAWERHLRAAPRFSRGRRREAQWWWDALGRRDDTPALASSRSWFSCCPMRCLEVRELNCLRSLTIYFYSPTFSCPGEFVDSEASSYEYFCTGWWSIMTVYYVFFKQGQGTTVPISIGLWDGECVVDANVRKTPYTARM